MSEQDARVDYVAELAGGLEGHNSRGLAMVLLEDLFYFDDGELARTFQCSLHAVRRARDHVAGDPPLALQASELIDAERSKRRQLAGRG